MISDHHPSDYSVLRRRSVSCGSAAMPIKSYVVLLGEVPEYVTQGRGSHVVGTSAEPFGPCVQAHDQARFGLSHRLQ